MKQIVCIFGSNSLLAKDFINTFYKKFNIIGVYSKSIDKEINKKLFKSFQLDIGKKQTYSQLQHFAQYIKSIVNNKKINFLLFSWCGKPRVKNKSEDARNKNINQKIIENFLCISSFCKPSKIIFLSSAGAIYDQINGDYSKENDQPKPSSSYGLQKLIAEQELNKFCNKNLIDLIILRVSSAYGYNPEFSDNGVLNKWLFQAKNDDQILIYNSLESSINFISFIQVSRSLEFCLISNIKGCFNLGSNLSTTLEEILEVVKKISGKDNLKLKFKGKSKRQFNLDSSLFRNLSKLNFKNEIEKEAYKIYNLIN